MIIRGQTKIEIDVSDQELGRALLARWLEMIGYEDPGCDYHTDDHGHVFMGGFRIIDDPQMAAMVDTANFLIYGKRLRAKDNIPPPPDDFPDFESERYKNMFDQV